MKKIGLVSCLLLLTALPLWADHVDPETARKVATTFLSNNGAKASQLTDLSKAAGFSNLYIFNAEEGFVIMSADDCVKPILGYSLTGKFVTEDMPENLVWWLQGYNSQIQDAVDSHMNPQTKTSELWKSYVSGDSKVGITNAVVDALVTTTWGQRPYYNELCPSLNNEHALTGCVATAMAQIIYYWNQTNPTTIGIGSHSYTHITYGVQSVNFAETVYDWTNMTQSYGSSSTQTQIQAVATLMYHCGVAVNMDYGISSSGAFSSDIPNALINYFYFSTTAQNILRGSSDTEWISTLKQELDNGRPLEYSGSGSGGHSFICDGYDNADYFHFNWGWTGFNNAFYSIDDLTPGNHNYNVDQKATIGIKPASCKVTGASNFYAELIDGTRNIRISWDAVEQAVAYKLFRNGSLIQTITPSKEKSFEYIDEMVPYGNNIYHLRCVDTDGEMSLPSTYGTVPLIFPAPTDLHASISENRTVNLSWNSVQNASFYNVYCNDVLIASNVSTNSFEDIHPISGSLSYYVRGVDSFGDETGSSVAANISMPYQTPCVNDLSVSLSGADANLSWSAAQWHYPSSSDASLNYGNGDIDYFFDVNYYGHRYLATDLVQHTNKLLYKVSTYIQSTGTYTVYVYTNTTSEGKPDVLRDTRVLSSLDGGGWKEIPLSSPILITGDEDLWIVFKQEGTQSEYPIPTFNLSKYNANACYCGNGTGPTDIIPYPYETYKICFFIMAYLSNGISYDIYDRDTKLNNTAILGTTFTHHNTETNIARQYKIKTHYSSSGESDSNIIGYTFGTASIGSLSLATNDKMTLLENSTLTVSGTLENDNPGNLILEDGAQLINNNTEVKATAKKTIDGFLTNDSKSGWYLIASPMIEQLNIAEATNLIAANASDYDLYVFDQSSASEWLNYKQDHFTTIDNKMGYLYARKNDIDIAFAGTLNNTVGSVDLTYSTGHEFSGFNLVGNPFPCNANINKDDYYHIVETAEGSKLQIANSVIAPMEGIFVRASDGNDKSVTFTKASAKGSPTSNGITMSASRDGGVLDIARIRFEGDQNMEKLMLRDGGTKIFIPLDGNEYAMVVKSDRDEIFVGFKASTDGTYTIGFETEGLDLDYLQLIDNLTGAKVNLLATPSYSFEANTDDYPSRFRLLFHPLDENQSTFDDILEGDIQILDMTGRVVATDRNAQLTPGVYILRSTNGNEVKTEKIIIK